ncbi:MAG: nucleotide sugar dehydrogenase [Candidatus Zixiibacteriota bacterium]
MPKKNTKNNEHYKKLIDKIKNRSARTGVLGLGYVGLPLSIELAKAGFKVTGFDISQDKVKRLNAGKSDIDDIPDTAVKNALLSKKFKATADMKLISKMNIVFICVPTPLSKTKDPDVSYILDAVNNIKTYIKKGTLVILESTTYPGTTQDLILPLLSENGKKVGADFFLAFSPERVDPGNETFTTKNTPRVVGGITPECTKIAKTLYEQTISKVYIVSSTRAAEMVKLLENTFRSVNIALVNEVALMCAHLNLDIWEIIDAAATKPFGFMPFYPGPGLGGHCIPIDPHYLSWKLRSLNYYARFIELAGDINSHMPEYVVERITNLLNKRFAKALNKSNVLILGVSYKRDIKDIRESPALDVIKLLEDNGSKTYYNDPFVDEFNWNGTKHKSIKLTDTILKKVDLVVILTDHTSYDYEFIAANSKAVFDTRNATKAVKKYRHKIELL